jgi:hypothetical protein
MLKGGQLKSGTTQIASLVYQIMCSASNTSLRRVTRLIWHIRHRNWKGYAGYAEVNSLAPRMHSLSHVTEKALSQATDFFKKAYSDKRSTGTEIALDRAIFTTDNSFSSLSLFLACTPGPGEAYSWRRNRAGNLRGPMSIEMTP